jgi:rhamnogalacturonan endolyase
MRAIPDIDFPIQRCRKVFASIALLSLLAACGTAFAAPGKQVEKLDRGAVAIHTSAGNFISWRSLGLDPAGLRFDIYRGSVKLNAQPLAVTNFVDADGAAGAGYSIIPAGAGGPAKGAADGAARPVAGAAEAWDRPYKTVPLQKPADGVTPDGQRYGYTIGDGSAADLDGDGSYELLVKWQPTNAHDNSHRGYTGNTYLDAYRLDGTRLWRIDLGRNIRAGAHYTTYLAYDFDGDGRAEIMMKTADGTIDGAGRVIGDGAADYRSKDGYVLAGPEFITVFDGRSGAALDSKPYLPGRGEVAAWGDAYGNRVDRFLGAVAYLDGSRPSAVFSRGYYTRAVLAAWDWRDGKLTSRWVFDSDKPGAGAAAGQGAHWMSVADVDGDGKDDLIYGAATIGSNGKLLYSTGLCHGDALHVGKLDPQRAGLQIFMVHESPSCYGANGIEMHDAATGKILWHLDGAGHDIGRGTCMDIDPAWPGEECWASVGGLTSASGVKISDVHPRSINFGLWWDGDLLRESLDRALVAKWNPRTQQLDPLLDGSRFGADSINGTKATPVLSADLFGDWREEVVWRSRNDDALLVFSTTLPTEYRMPTLMHDPQYRAQVAAQNAGYNQPPHPSFFLGAGMPPVVQAPIHTP